MDYTVVGFPRIGEHRELKFATEKYFKGESDENELIAKAAELRLAQWKKLQAAGVSLIPSNDYSFYDGILDTSFMVNAVPKRYRELGLTRLATYFALARGYQKDGKNVTAESMKKWFNTNYHYMVPEIDDDAEIRLSDTYFLDAYNSAKESGIETRVNIIGPFTFLKLARFTGNKNISDFEDAFITCYRDIIAKAKDAGVKWLQIEEPYLVRDLNSADISLFIRLYEKILEGRHDIKILLATYFGDIRDIYDEVIKLPFDGIGIDFVEGLESLNLIRKYGFPDDKILFAGIINGKNIWINDYKKSLALISELKKYCGNIVLSTSCSLLHVPYTTANESKMDASVKKHFAFAYEKLGELKELALLSELEDYNNSELFIDNQKKHSELAAKRDPDVVAAVNNLTEADFTRTMPRKERQELQRKELGLPLFPTTTIGSFPQTKEVKKNRADYKKGLISKEEYDKNIDGFIADCIKKQEELGIDVLVHGEFERNDMVEFFGENLSGYVDTENGWVQSYGTRGVKPPIICGDVKRIKPITVREITYANSLTKKDVKGMLTGPVTILNWSFPREDISIKESMYQIGLAIRDEVLDLEKAGVRIIQIDEAALREKLPIRKCDWNDKYLDFAIKAFRLCHAKVKPETQIHTHMCYSEFEDIVKAIDDMDADVISFEASRSKLTILDALAANNFETEVGPGVYDIHSPRIPSVEEIKGSLTKILKKIPRENLWVNPDCGLKTRGWEETIPSLKNMVEAAKELRSDF